MKKALDLQLKILDMISLKNIKLIVKKLDDNFIIKYNDQLIKFEKAEINNNINLDYNEIDLEFVDQIIKFRIYEDSQLIKNDNFDLKLNFIKMFVEEDLEIIQ